MVDFLSRLRAARVVPVIRHPDAEIALQACQLLVEAGVDALEITMSVPDAPEIIAKLRSTHPSICVGAGTVLTSDDATRVLVAGAEFVVSPCWSDSVATAVRNADIPYLPGAMTPGEVLHHADSGATLIKIFPADAAGGAGFLKALKSVFPDVALMPTGGVSPTNCRAYFDAGAVCVGMGGNLLPAAALEAGDLATARHQIDTALAAALS